MTKNIVQINMNKKIGYDPLKYRRNKEYLKN